MKIFPSFNSSFLFPMFTATRSVYSVPITFSSSHHSFHVSTVQLHSSQYSIPVTIPSKSSFSDLSHFSHLKHHKMTSTTQSPL